MQTQSYLDNILLFCKVGFIIEKNEAEKRYLTLCKAKTVACSSFLRLELPTLINFCLFNLKTRVFFQQEFSAVRANAFMKWKIHKSSQSVGELFFEIRQEGFLIKIKAANSNLCAPGEIRNSSPLQFQFTGTQQWATINIRCSLWHGTQWSFQKGTKSFTLARTKAVQIFTNGSCTHAFSFLPNKCKKITPTQTHSATNSLCICTAIKNISLWHLGDTGVAAHLEGKSFLDAFTKLWAHKEGALIMIKFLGGGQRKCRVEGNTCWPTIPTGRQLRCSSLLLRNSRLFPRLMK